MEGSTVRQELTKLALKRWPNIKYVELTAFVNEFELELPRLRELQVKEDKLKAKAGKVQDDGKTKPKKEDSKKTA